MAQTNNYDNIDDPGVLRDPLRRRDQLVAELRGENDEQTDLIRRLRSMGKIIAPRWRAGRKLSAWC